MKKPSNNSWKYHPSYLGKLRVKEREEFERLEILGDAITGFLIVDLLIKHTDFNDGKISIYKSFLASKDQLAKVAQFLLPDMVYKGQITNKILSDCFEVWIACCYLDGEDMQQLAKDIWLASVYQHIEKPAKNLLQEFAQRKNKTISSEYFQENGQYVCLFKIGKEIAYGYGTSKKKASMDAAKKLLEIVDESSYIRNYRSSK